MPSKHRNPKDTPSSPPTATVTTYTKTPPPVGTVGVNGLGIPYIVIAHVPAGVLVEDQNGRTHTIAPQQFPPLPKPGTAIYRAAQTLTRDRGWLAPKPSTQSHAAPAAEDNETKPMDLRRFLALTTEALVMAENATTADADFPLHVNIDGEEIEGLDGIDARDLDPVMESLQDASDAAMLWVGRAVRQVTRNQLSKGKGGAA